VIERWLIVEDGTRAGFLDDPQEHDQAAKTAGSNFRFCDF
jgi:hypothetical protein